MITFVQNIETCNAITHGGSHHADDVFGMVLLENFYENVRIYRLPFNYRPLIFNQNIICFDVLNGRFDHHQRGGNGYHEVIENGATPIPNASFGLLWQEFGRKIIQKRGIDDKILIEFLYEYIDVNLVRAIDAADNGIFPLAPSKLPKHRILAISAIISLLNDDDETRPQDDNKNLGLLFSIKLARKTFDVIFEHGQKEYFSQFPAYEVFSENLDKDDFYGETVYNTFHPCLKKHLNKPTSSFEEAWNSAKDDFCKDYFAEESNEALRYIDGLAQGLIIDIENKDQDYIFKQNYDKMEVCTLHKVFSSKGIYGDSYEADLTNILERVATNILATTSRKIQAKKYIENKVAEQLGKRILVLDKKSYWQDWIARNKNAGGFWFVVSPADTAGWKVQPIPNKYNPNGYRKGFPSKWYGYNRDDTATAKEFRKYKLPYGVQFIHSQGFLALTDTLESALKLCEKAFGNQECIPRQQRRR